MMLPNIFPVNFFVSYPPSIIFFFLFSVYLFYLPSMLHSPFFHHPTPICTKPTLIHEINFLRDLGNIEFTTYVRKYTTSIVNIFRERWRKVYILRMREVRIHSCTTHFNVQPLFEFLKSFCILRFFAILVQLLGASQLLERGQSVGRAGEAGQGR